MKAIVKQITIDKLKRIIIISDIHGNLNLFKRLLSEVAYSENDILILLGDLIEKGTKNIETLQYIMQLSQEREVYVVKGNCDVRWQGIETEGTYKNQLRQNLFRKNSLLREMCEALQIDIDKTFDIDFIKRQLSAHFSSILNWLEALPHILETERFICAHAGITSENLELEQAKEVLRRDAFLEEGTSFSKYVIVGHWPTANYGREKGCCNPIIHKEQKIISIDGGNAVRVEGQLNALIIHEEDFSFHSVDDLPKEKVIKPQKASTNSIQITLMDNAIEILEKGETFSCCKHLSTGHELWIKNNKIYKDKDHIRCYDVTDYFIEAKTDDVVSIIERAPERTLVKKEGIIGWILNENLED